MGSRSMSRESSRSSLPPASEEAATHDPAARRIAKVKTDIKVINEKLHQQALEHSDFRLEQIIRAVDAKVQRYGWTKDPLHTSTSLAALLELWGIQLGYLLERTLQKSLTPSGKKVTLPLQRHNSTSSLLISGSGSSKSSVAGSRRPSTASSGASSRVSVGSVNAMSSMEQRAEFADTLQHAMQLTETVPLMAKVINEEKAEVRSLVHRVHAQEREIVTLTEDIQHLTAALTQALREANKDTTSLRPSKMMMSEAKARMEENEATRAALQASQAQPMTDDEKDLRSMVPTISASGHVLTMEDMKKEVQLLKRELKDKNLQLLDGREKYSDLLVRLDGAEKDKQRLRQELATAAKDIASVKQEGQNAKKVFARQMAALKDSTGMRIDTLEQENKKLMKRAESVVSSTARELSSLKEALFFSRQEAARFKSTHLQYGSDINHLKDEVQKYQSQASLVPSLQKDIQVLHAQTERLQQELLLLRRNEKKMETDQATAHSKLSRVQLSLSNKTAALLGSHALHEERKKESEDLKFAADSMEVKLKRAQNDMGLLEQARDALQLQLDHAKQGQQQLQRANAALQSKLDTTEADLSSKIAQIVSLEEDLAVREQQVVDARILLVTTRKDADATKRNFTDMVKEQQSSFSAELQKKADVIAHVTKSVNLLQTEVRDTREEVDTEKQKVRDADRLLGMVQDGQKELVQKHNSKIHSLKLSMDEQKAAFENELSQVEKSQIAAQKIFFQQQASELAEQKRAHALEARLLAEEKRLVEKEKECLRKSSASLNSKLLQSIQLLSDADLSQLKAKAEQQGADSSALAPLKLKKLKTVLAAEKKRVSVVEDALDPAHETVSWTNNRDDEVNERLRRLQEQCEDLEKKSARLTGRKHD